ncbi:MAG: sensor histidine kinase [Bacteroides sp.]
MRFGIFVIILILGVLPMMIMEYAMHGYYRQARINDAQAQLQVQAVALAGEISKYHDVSLTKIESYENIMRQYSTFNDARVLLVDYGYVIAYDTYLFEKGKTIVSENVIKAFTTKKTSSSYNKATGSIEVMTPVLDIDKNAVAVVIMDMDASEALAYTDDVMQKTYIIRVSTITMLIILGLFVSWALVHPLQNVKKQVNDISMGHYDRRIEVDSYTELAEMTSGFNDILDKMNNLDESRQEFVSNVSHELKTPITSMKVLADSLNTQEDVPIELYKEFMSDIVEEIDRESKIIDDLLTLVKMDKSAMTLNISSVNINELLELILKRLKPIAQKKNIELLFESFRPVVAQIDEVKFTIAVSNLVENAIKYNKDDGWVHVSLNADHQYFYVRVEDNGIGIPQESQKMVFERFYRVDKARSRQTGGTGLGLAIVRNAVLMHHGAIRLHSEEDVGTTFTVRIPLNYVEE